MWRDHCSPTVSYLPCLKLGESQPVSVLDPATCHAVLVKVNDSRKTAIIDRELTRLNIDVAALQETRLASNSSLREQNYAFFCEEFSVVHCRITIHGTAHILSLCLSTFSGPVNILNIYAPTLCSSAEIKDQFYEELDTTIRDFPAIEQLYLLSARVGIDHDSWPSCIGHFGIGKMNENGQRLLDLCITNTFFATKPHRRVPWRHPRSRHWHQLDLVIIRRPSLNCVLTTRSYHSADCDTDHSMAVKSISNTSGSTNTSRKFTPVLTPARQQSQTCVSALPTPSRMPSKTALMTTLKKASKRAALINHKTEPSLKSLAAHRKARNDAQRIARRCVNDYWLNLCESIQFSADCGNIRGMYEGMKKVFGSSINKIAHLKSTAGDIITDRSRQMESLRQASLEKIANLPPKSSRWEEDCSPHYLHHGCCSAGRRTVLQRCATPSMSTTLYKKQVHLSACNNYRGIPSQHCWKGPSPPCSRQRLQLLAERVFPEAQCGFRDQPST
ncbi:craniofacial development protein 2-like [Penaeus monodon]|uniref:craniofacial development protein 2-like n=1 Tax=Penaeus monodon TaxID=6687 RepID=UPI0018A77973|nr:craniofacial development protein 2-like [Penaeus monodon]